MKSPKFITKKKFLTQYALKCGYIETTQGVYKEKSYFTLEMDSCCFHVKGRVNNSKFIWESFYNYKEAKKFFMKMLKENKLKRKIPYVL